MNASDMVPCFGLSPEFFSFPMLSFGVNPLNGRTNWIYYRQEYGMSDCLSSLMSKGRLCRWNKVTSCFASMSLRPLGIQKPMFPAPPSGCPTRPKTGEASAPGCCCQESRAPPDLGRLFRFRPLPETDTVSLFPIMRANAGDGILSEPERGILLERGLIAE
jgi:hypothetical protein